VLSYQGSPQEERSLSTGYGKSLCYQTLPFVMDNNFGLTGSASQSCVVLVVSSLIALMDL